jgi:RNA polymerase sigma factor (TIGR02999 family)
MLQGTDLAAPPPGSITNLLLELRASGSNAPRIHEQLYSAIYAELRARAAGLMRKERGDHTLQPTALVHEAYLKLVDVDRVDWRNRSHFLAVATRAMRQVLVDHARSRGASKRGKGWERISVDGIADPTEGAWLDLLDFDVVLHRLASLDPRVAQVAELRVIGGMTHEDIAEVLGVSVRTVAEDWAVGKRWLARELKK